MNHKRPVNILLTDAMQSMVSIGLLLPDLEIPQSDSRRALKPQMSDRELIIEITRVTGKLLDYAVTLPLH